MVSPTYYPIQRKWRQLRPVFERPAVLELMHSEMECYAQARAEDYGYKHKPTPFTWSLRPADYDSCDWRWGNGRRGPQPGYWAWACVGSCHWVASHNLAVISMLEPDRPWQIATSDKHSTVVDLARELLFDPTFQALGLTPEECWKEAVSWHNTELLPIGNLMLHDLEAAA